LPERLNHKKGYVRSVGLSLQVRKGFWAPRHAVGPAEQERDELPDAVFSSDQIRDIPLDLQTRFFKSGDQKAELTAPDTWMSEPCVFKKRRTGIRMR
jgi:hypothetical protein